MSGSAGLGAGERKISCTIGGVSAGGGKTADTLYREADRLLYQAKQQGRDRYVLEEAPGPAAGGAPAE